MAVLAHVVPFVAVAALVAHASVSRPAIPLAPPLRVAVGQVRGAPDFRDALVSEIRHRGDVAPLDEGLVDAALAGSGYDGSVNLSRSEARRLSQVCGVDLLVFAVASVVDLGGVAHQDTWDARAGVFIVDGRTGELTYYVTLAGHGADRESALKTLTETARRDIAGWTPILDRIRTGRSGPVEVASEASLLDLVANPEGATGDTPPRFFRRPHPVLTPDAERFRVSATVDVVVEFLADGTFGSIAVVKWAGFGLDEACIAAIRDEKFFPARHSGHHIGARALLRFNFTFDDK